MTHDEALALARDVAASEWHYRSSVWRLRGPDVVALATALLAEHERRVEAETKLAAAKRAADENLGHYADQVTRAQQAEQQIITLRAKLDRADCSQREGGDTRHCRVDAPCWRCRAEQADARIRELEASLSRQIAEVDTRLRERAELVDRIRKLEAELVHIDAVMARRPALDKPTRVENIEHAIASAGRFDDRIRELEASLMKCDARMRDYDSARQAASERAEYADARIRELEAGLRKYGRHIQCDAGYLSVCGDSQRCRCGLDVLLTRKEDR